MFTQVSNFIEDEPNEIVIHDEEDFQEVNSEGYFYEDIVNEDEGFVSEGPWIETPDEYSSVKPLNAEPETYFVQSGSHRATSANNSNYYDRKYYIYF